ncbi:MAG: prepilin-type N-terminal cleavage/methylation domain-containing protein, partial [Elusimicrobia bacterium]|nr:prepilin-type N-terminal cleavage/methylation domain-containing protein [Elusimicrobiota bacterium]
MKTKKRKGFTLIELVIVIMIITILSTVSVPIYKGHISNAKSLEGYTLLASIRDAQ